MTMYGWGVKTQQSDSNDTSRENGQSNSSQQGINFNSQNATQQANIFGYGSGNQENSQQANSGNYGFGQGQPSGNSSNNGQSFSTNSQAGNAGYGFGNNSQAGNAGYGFNQGQQSAMNSSQQYNQMYQQQVGDYPSMQQQFPQADNKEKFSGLAIAAFVLSFLGGILGMVLSIVAIVTTGKGKKRGRGLAVAALVISLVVMAGSAVVVKRNIDNARESVASSQVAMQDNSPKKDKKSYVTVKDWFDNSSQAKVEKESLTSSLKAAGLTGELSTKDDDTLLMEVNLSSAMDASANSQEMQTVYSKLGANMQKAAAQIKDYDIKGDVNINVSIKDSKGTVLYDKTYNDKGDTSTTIQ